ncbi:zinc finger protein 518B [Centropristis striata]|uniref:zinc finger protein 518B n=1 Tax=Centropristis striata TaxID=184440 RepID=UPI0027E0F126|nr:zinc finger protein 518B [Centropristis striata]XP_059202608.1 zinc finger protein 518B [Centropristis striata]
MIPVSYHSMRSPVSGHPTNLVLDRVLSSTNVKGCQKCGFACTDPAEYRKHMMEHGGTQIDCFYCNKVSFSVSELNAHMKEHKSKYPFICPHCGQGYMRRLCLVKHIDRLHNKSLSQGPAKAGVTKLPHVAVSGALSSSVPVADTSLIRPTVRVTVPSLNAPAVRLGKEEHRGKTLDTNLSNATNGNADLLTPLSGLIQHNRALTVSLPEEVTIPAGCLVELVEVKTVNGTKELKLRLVSQQENESVIKDTRTTVSQNSALGKPFLTSISHPHAVKTASMGMCLTNGKGTDTKTVNLERPAAVPIINISKNIPSQVSREKTGLKRTSQEIINLECHTVIPNKIPKSTLHPVREVNSGIKVSQREAVNLAAPMPSVISSRSINGLHNSMHPENMMASVSQRVTDERRSVNPARRVGEVKILPRDVSAPVKLEPGEVGQTKSPSKLKMRPQKVLVCKNNASPSFSMPVKSLLPSKRTNSKLSAWTQEARFCDRAGAGEGEVAEPEGFPVISSVFSLSQQPEDVQGSMQPLVMALRGIVMDKSSSSCAKVDLTNSGEQVKQVKQVQTVGFSAQVATKQSSNMCNGSLTERSSESVKVEQQDKVVQHPPALIHVKKEHSSTTPRDDKKCSHTPAVKPPADNKSVPTQVNTPELQQQVSKSDQDISSKFLTVSLKRVQVGVWKKTKKGLKLRISKYKTQGPVGSPSDCTVIYPMPLKQDQLVKRPSPNQPVVVLNHPKPRASVQRASADTLADTAASDVAPKCQILKMRLSKVMGQKYEVMGCTVGVFP